MSDKPKPRWFQFHLSTAIVGMLIAGALLWLEVGPPRSQPFDKLRTVSIQGWPWAARYECIALDSEEAAIGADYPPMFIWIWTNVAKDAIACVSILAVVAFISEHIIRRREASK